MRQEVKEWNRRKVCQESGAEGGQAEIWKLRRETRDDRNRKKEGDERITDKRAEDEQRASHPTVTSHNLLCSGP